QIARFMPSCTSVLITLYALDMKGLVHIYRNGKTVRTLTGDLDIDLASVTLQRNDVVTIEKPALATYVHHPAATCPGAAPVVGPPPAAAAAKALPSPSVP